MSITQIEKVSYTAKAHTTGGRDGGASRTSDGRLDVKLSVPELGYEVTMVKDATADYSDEEMHAALDVNIPNYASAIVTTNEIVASISSL